MPADPGGLAKVQTKLTESPVLAPPHPPKHHPPDSATSEMGTPCSWDMKPRMEKMANPATKLVPLLRKQRAMQSLQAGRGGGDRRVRGAASASGRDAGTPGDAAGLAGAEGTQGAGSVPPTPWAQTWTKPTVILQE